ncbi:tRNA modification GTPase [Fuerstiella marisgermanici]|uniref:tRNA modification GTPase MnmE n=1 Tax=Fuerstiella marisgermanici TaxID=1891926 RepID=A0A1P8WIU5_9PLAN|nr:tRNA modification GTPase [Fuerstiella marisgermanici]APZ93985.1 tRNA modification GTPase MnmE [Fuerstiella marisgermanici]
MPLDLNDTIAAIASPPGPAERGIVRISGDGLVDVLRKVFTDDDDLWPNAKRAARFNGSLNVPAIGIPLPTALMLWPTSRSYTGQPMAELHTTGAPPLLDAVLERVLECGARHANRGEFTMRAFLAGRIDLVQAEAVLGVIDAADHSELQAALSQLGGGITQTLVVVRNEILTLLGDLEAGLDFVEEDIEFISNKQICDRLTECHVRLQKLLNVSDDRLPSGLRRRVVLAGLPNAGKSTLFNRLLGSQRAIVSPIAGTTRDYLSGIVVIGGVEIELIDTAGWEAAADLIMERAQDLRSEQVHGSDLVIWCRATDMNDAASQEDDRLRSQLDDQHLQVLDVFTRCDLVDQFKGENHVSAETGQGIPELLHQIERVLSQDRSAKSELVSSTAARCRDTLRRAIASIEAARAASEQQLGDEITAFELRDSLHQIATMLGEVYTDDILDHIFSNFCIGK